MAYVTPSTVTAGTSPVTAAAQNILVNDIIAIYESIKRVAFTSTTTTYTVNQTVLASASNVFATSASWTADGTSAYRVKVFIPQINIASTNNALVSLFLTNNAGTSIANLGNVGRPGNGELIETFINTEYYYTPVAGAVTLNVRATYGTASGSTFTAASNNLMFLKVYGADLI